MITNPLQANWLKEAERRLRWLAGLIVFNVVLSTSYQDALFLAHHQEQNIPPAMLLGSLLSAPVVVVLVLLLRKRPMAGMLRVILLSLGVLTLGAAAWNHRPTPMSTFGLFLFIEVATTVGVAATWTYFQTPLEVAQIRWLLPRLGTYAGLGGLLAGVAITMVLRQASKPEHLIWVAGVAWLVSGMLVRTDYGARAPAKQRGAGQQSELRYLLSSPLVRWITIGAAGIVWTGLLLQYETRVAMQSVWEPSQIAYVMSIILATSSVGGIATQALLTTPVLERWGVGLALTILPTLMMVCLGIYFYASFEAHSPADLTVWIILAALLLDKTLRPNLHYVAESCLVAALPPSVRPNLLVVLGGILYPIIKAVGALLLWVGAASVDARYLTMAAVVLALLMTLLGFRWGSLYARTLQQTLTEVGIDLIGASDASEGFIPTIDGTRLPMVLEAIDMGPPRSRELALELLRLQRSNLVANAMQARTHSPNESVRLAALRWLSEGPSLNPDLSGKGKWEQALRWLDALRPSLVVTAGVVMFGAVGLLLIGLSTWAAASGLLCVAALLLWLAISGQPVVTLEFNVVPLGTPPDTEPRPSTLLPSPDEPLHRDDNSASGRSVLAGKREDG